MSAVLKESTDTRQLQLWNAKTKAYEHRMDAEDIPFNNVRSYANGRPWRICKPERPLKNPRHNPPRHTGSAYTVEEKQAAYLAWAQAKGLSHVTAFHGRPPFNCGRTTYWNSASSAALSEPIYTGEIRYVDAGMYFHVTEETES